MSEPNRHSYVQVNDSFVHLVQYGRGESVLRTRLNRSTSGSNSDLSLSAGDHHEHHQSRSTKLSSSASSNQNENSAIESTATKSGISRNDSYLKANQSSNTSVKKLIVFVPGNPGMLGMYHDFLSALCKLLSRPSPKAGGTPKSSSNGSHHGHRRQSATQQDLPVILAISHNNFDLPDQAHCSTQTRIIVDKSELNFLERSMGDEYEPHHVELQVINKLIILKKLLTIDLTRNCQIIFVGHSIGCYIILRLLQDKVIARAHCGTIMLHPALENLAITEKGAVMARYFSFKVDLVIQTLAFILEKLLPNPLKRTLAKWYCPSDFIESSSEEVIDSFVQIACAPTLNAIIQMAKSEFEWIKSLNHETMIAPHVNKLRMIYAIEDHWVNSEHRRELSQLYPELYIEEQPNMHAFVMQPRTVMDYAVKVAILIRELLEHSPLC